MCRTEKYSVESSTSEENDLEIDLDTVQGWLNREAIDRARYAIHGFLNKLRKDTLPPSLLHENSSFEPPFKRRLKEEPLPEYSQDIPLVFKHPQAK